MDKQQIKKSMFRILAVTLISATCIYGIVIFTHSLSHERTDDAYVTGVIIPVSAEVRGKVVAVYIRDNQYVTASDSLLEIFRDDTSIYWISEMRLCYRPRRKTGNLGRLWKRRRRRSYKLGQIWTRPRPRKILPTRMLSVMKDC